METTPCGKCGAAVPTPNLTLHSLLCCPDDAVALDAGWNAGFGIA